MIQAFGLVGAGFNLEEASSYLLKEVVRKGEDRTGKSIVDTNGIVIGLLVLNDEIELVVKWSEGLKQYVKGEFQESIEVLDD
ncbi:hypothetical protein [Reinekea marinisedimentorum]|uniref:Uncharacterized protein n=1 Tax=Reinekea marinisedimentorum TaxID=230495 RepID=A0A4R3I495_9GAMM|nr:hypothetical protein [Reinekea marinisedimentorum]TCS40410.1 hypothetical protein BCF53_109120 [Reinekea marinisedimentorum]